MVKPKVLFLVFCVSFHGNASGSPPLKSSFTSPTYSREAFLQLDTFSKVAEGDDCTVKFLIDKNKKRFVLKQVKNGNIREQIKLIFDYVASSIASEMGVPIPRTYLIPKNWTHRAKTYPNRIAILQEMVPGKAIEEEGAIRLHQRSRSSATKQLMDKRFGTLPEKRKGLNRRVIRSMAHHEDLATIAAFDTFINNSDRSAPNLFYDKKSDHYYGIDHFAAFDDKKLAHYALRQIANHTSTFSEKDWVGIRRYFKMLKVFYEKFPPSIVIKRIRGEIELFFPEQVQNSDVRNMLVEYENFIKQNYKDCGSLIDHLSTIDKATG